MTLNSDIPDELITSYRQILKILKVLYDDKTLKSFVENHYENWVNNLKRYEDEKSKIIKKH